MVLQIKSSGLDGSETFQDSDQTEYTTALLDAQTYFLVTQIRFVVVPGQQSVVDTENAAWLQNPEDFCIHSLEGRSMYRGLDRIDSNKGTIRERHLLEKPACGYELSK